MNAIFNKSTKLAIMILLLLSVFMSCTNNRGEELPEHTSISNDAPYHASDPTSSTTDSASSTTQSSIEQMVYESWLQGYVSKCYQIMEDIAYFRSQGHDDPEYDAILALLERGIAERPRGYRGSSEISKTDSTLLSTYGLANIWQLNQEYPQYGTEDPLFEVMHWAVAYDQMYRNKSYKVLLDDPDARAVFFPNLGELKVNYNDDGTTTVYYEGYEGKLAVYVGEERSPMIDKSDPNLLFFDRTAVFDNDHGTISVAPIGLYGFVGPITYIEGPDKDIKLYAYGPKIFLGPNSESVPAEITGETAIAEDAAHVLQALEGTTYLMDLRINRCKIDALSVLLAAIEEPEKLLMLILKETYLSGEADLSAMSGLTIIELIDQPELTSVKLPDGSTMLANLNLKHTGVKTLDFLREIQTVYQLNLVNNPISTLAPLAGKQIESLSFSMNEGLDIGALSEIVGLERLTVTGGKEFEAAIRAELQSMPDVEIIFKD